MEKYNGSLIRQFDSESTGNAGASVSVTVRTLPSLGLATIYSVNDTSSNPLSNPLQTDSRGRYSFYAVNGRYQLDFGTGEDSIEILLQDGIDEQAVQDIIDQLETEALSRSKVSSPVTLTSGQTLVSFEGFNASLSSYYISSVGGDVPSYRLFEGQHYTIEDEVTEEITLLDTYSAGTNIYAASLDPTGTGTVVIPSQFDTVVEMQAATSIPEGSIVDVIENGNPRYKILASGTTLLSGDKTLNNGQVAQLQQSDDGNYNVSWFGADGTLSTATDQVTAFNAAALRAVQDQNGTNKSPMLVITKGNYRLNSATTNKATWIKTPAAKIIGLAGVSPTFEDDTSYLSGTVIDYSGVDQQRTVRYGDPKFTVQKYSGKGYASEITACSDDAAGGITAMTHSSANDTVNQACIAGTFVGLQNNSNVEKSTWALYLEGIRDVGNDSAVFCMESTMFNRGATVKSSPYGLYHLPQVGLPAWNLWLTSGGTQDGVQDCNPATGAIGIKANDGVPFDKGILFKEDSLLSPAIAIATPDSYKWAWFGSTGGNEIVSARISGSLPSNGNFNVDVYNATSSALNTWILTPFALTFSINNQANIGSASSRIQTIYLQNAPDVVSDKTKKTSIRELTDNELAAGLALARDVQMFKWVDEVAQKGEADSYYHASVMAQEAWDILTDNGLDPTDYGFISNSGNGWSVSPSELSMLMCSALVKNQDLLEQRIAALENV